MSREDLETFVIPNGIVPDSILREHMMLKQSDTKSGKQEQLEDTIEQHPKRCFLSKRIYSPGVGIAISSVSKCSTDIDGRVSNDETIDNQSLNNELFHSRCLRCWISYSPLSVSRICQNGFFHPGLFDSILLEWSCCGSRSPFFRGCCARFHQWS